MNREEGRLEYLDTAKGFCIILIVLSHIYDNTNPIKYWVQSFHVPVFFIVSGILLKHTNVERRDLRYILKSKAKSLLIPYFFFELIDIFVYMLTNEFSMEVLRWNIIDSVMLYSRAEGTWFLICIFAAEIIFIITRKYSKSNFITIGTSTLLFFTPFIIRTDNHFVIVLFRIFMGVGFLSFGYYSSEFVKSKQYNYFIIISAVIINIILGVNNKLVGMFGLTFNNKLIYIICSLLGSFSIIFLFKRLNVIYLKYFGMNSLIVLGTHGVILELLRIYTKIKFEGYFSGLTILFITMSIEVIIIEGINKYIPFIIGKKKNNKNLSLKTVG